jgi:hypothetical protein
MGALMGKENEDILKKILMELKEISRKLDDVNDNFVEFAGDIEQYMEDIESFLTDKFDTNFEDTDYCGPGEYRRSDGSIGKVGE